MRRAPSSGANRFRIANRIALRFTGADQQDVTIMNNNNTKRSLIKTSSGMKSHP
jgi:hypothetical protein